MLQFQRIVVLGDYRRRVIATKLVEHLRGLARGLGLVRIELDVYSASPVIKKIYTVIECGYAIVRGGLFGSLVI